jgi:hypothetical protein
MNRRMFSGWALAVVTFTAAPALAQVNVATAMTDLAALSAQVRSTDTRVRVHATHRVWAIALASSDSQVKLMSFDLLREPIGSSSDHIRMPAMYAIGEIANSTPDPQVKVRALQSLAAAFKSEQLPARGAAVDVVNLITRSATSGGVGTTPLPGVAAAAVSALGPVVRSGNNGVRIPAINAVVRAVVGSQDPAAAQQAMDLLMDPLNSSALIGGMEVRMMAIAAMEKIGIDVTDIPAKAKAMVTLQMYAAKDSWEPEAKKRAQDAADGVKATMK